MPSRVIRLSSRGTTLLAKTILSLFKIENEHLKLSYFDVDEKKLKEIFDPLQQELRDVEDLSHKPSPKNLSFLFDLFYKSGSDLRSAREEMKPWEDEKTNPNLAPIIKAVYKMTSCSEIGKALDGVKEMLEPCMEFLEKKMEVGRMFIRSIDEYSHSRMGLTNLPLKVAMGETSRESAKEFANDLLKVTNEIIKRANNFYSLAPDIKMRSGLSLLGIPIVYEINLKKIQQMGATYDWNDCVILQTNNVELSAIPEIKLWQDQDQVTMLKIFEGGEKNRGGEKDPRRKRKVLLEDILDFLHALNANHPANMTLGEIEEKICCLGRLERNFEDYRQTEDDALNEVPIMIEGRTQLKNTKEQLSLKKIILLEAKEDQKTNSRLEENASKAKREEISRSMPRLVLPDLLDGSNFMGWSSMFEIINKHAGTSESAQIRMMGMVKMSLKNDEDKKAALTIYTLPNLIDYLTKKYVSNANLTQDTLKKVLSFEQPKTLVQSLSNMLEIQKALNCIKAANLTSKLSLEMLSQLEFGSFTYKGLEDYLKDEAKANRTDPLSSTVLDTPSEVNPLDITTAIQKEAGKEELDNRREYFIHYLTEQTGVLRKVINTKKDHEARYGKKSPKAARKGSPKNKRKVEESRMFMYDQKQAPERHFQRGKGQSQSKGGTHSGFSYDKNNVPPSKPCPFQCSLKVHWYGSGAFCRDFKKMDVEARNAAVIKYYICKKCLKKVTHKPDSPCKAPNCSNCQAAHHPLLCKRSRPGVQNLHAAREEDEDDDENEEEADDCDYYDSELVMAICGRPPGLEESDEEDDKSDDENVNGGYEDKSAIPEPRSWNEESEDIEEIGFIDIENNLDDYEIPDTAVYYSNFSHEECDNYDTDSEDDFGEEINSFSYSFSERAPKYLVDMVGKVQTGKFADLTVSKDKNSDVEADSGLETSDVMALELGKDDQHNDKDNSKEEENLPEEEMAKMKKEDIDEEALETPRKAIQPWGYGEGETWKEIINEGLDCSASLNKEGVGYSATLGKIIETCEHIIGLNSDIKVCNVCDARVNGAHWDPAIDDAGSSKSDQPKHRWPPPYRTSMIDSYKNKIAKRKFVKSLFGPVKFGKYKCPYMNPDYVKLGPNSSKDALYEQLKRDAAKLFNVKYNLQGTVVSVRVVLDEADWTNSDMPDLVPYKIGNRWVINIGILLDTGADGGVCSSLFSNIYRMPKLKKRRLKLTTVHGIETKTYRRHRISFLCNDNETVFSTDCLAMEELGFTKFLGQQYYVTALQQLGLNKLPKHDLDTLFDMEPRSETKIQAIIGVRSNSMLAQRIFGEQLGLVQNPLSPDLGIYMSPLARNLFIAGKIGINPETFNKMGPTFFLPPQYKYKPILIQDHDINEDIFKELNFSLNSYPTTKRCYYDPTMGGNEIKIFMSSIEGEMVKRFIQDESLVTLQDPKCPRHSNIPCNDCDQMSNRNSLADKAIYQQLYENMRAIKLDSGKFKLEQTYVYGGDVNEIFNPENTNFSSALGSARGVAKKLLRKGKNALQEYSQQFKKAEGDGTLIPLTDKQIEELKLKPHFYTQHGAVRNEVSQSTNFRMITNTSTAIKNHCTTLSILNYCPKKLLNEQSTVLVNFMLYPSKYCSDVGKAYRCIGVDQLTAHLRLSIWFQNPEKQEGVIIYRRDTSDFGDSQASAALEIGCRKFVASACKLEESRRIVQDLRYADNNCSSFPDKMTFYLVQPDLDRAFDLYSLKLKYTITDAGTDHKILEKLNRQDQQTEVMLGLRWHIPSNTLLPNVYFSLFGKTRGASQGPPLSETDLKNVKITRHMMSRVAAQAHDILGFLLGPLIFSAKVLLSRCCEIASATQLDLPIGAKDPEFEKVLITFLTNVKRTNEINPTESFVIPYGNQLWGLIAARDGGLAGFGSTCHVLSEKARHPQKLNNNLYSKIIGSKGKIAKRSTTAHEILSFPLSIKMLYFIARPLLGKFHDFPLKLFSVGDSTCTAALFNPELSIKNVLLRNAVNSTLDSGRDLIKLYPKAILKFAWCQGTQNPADLMSKLFLDPIGAINSTLFRHGPEFYSNKKMLEKFVFLEIDSKGVMYTPLPDEITKIETNTLKNINKPFHNFDQGYIETCNVCFKQEELCGAIMTRAQKQRLLGSAKGEDAPLGQGQNKGAVRDTNVIRRENNDQQLVGSVSKDHNKKLTLLNRMPDGRFSLFPSVDTSLSFNGKLNLLEYEIIMSKSGNFWGIFYKICHLMNFAISMRSKIRPKATSILSVQQQSWITLIKSSQQHFPPRANKTLKPIIVNGCLVVKFKLEHEDAMQIFGTPMLPILSSADPLCIKLIEYAHVVQMGNFKGIHNGPKATMARIKSGPFGVTFDNMGKLLSHFLLSCPMCNFHAERSYTPLEGRVYSGLKIEGNPFQQISIDPLGFWMLKPNPTSRNPIKMFPLLCVCIQLGAVQILLMETAETKSVILCLKQMEARFGKIKRITTDAGSNLLKMNLNPPLTISDERFFNDVEIINHPTDSQFRNRSERATQIVKKFFRQTQGKCKKMKMPVLTICEFNFLAEKISDLCNEIPYCGDSEDVYLNPNSFIKPGIQGEFFTLENTNSHLKNINLMVSKIREYLTIAKEIRNNQLSKDLKKYAESRVASKSRLKLDLEANVGDVIFIKNRDKMEDLTFGVIEKLISGQTALIRTRKGSVEQPIRNVHPLVMEQFTAQRTVVP